MKACLAAFLAAMAAAGEAEALETEKWQSAIDAAAAAGGGRVTVPAGRHRVGGLEIRSNVELHLAKGAVLEGAVGLENYRLVELPYSEGVWSAIVMGLNVTNVAITGEGEIFGNGKDWTQPENFCNNEESERARGVFFSDSKDIRLEDFLLRDVGCWGIVLKCCDGVVARRVRIDSHVNANNDGFDIEAANAVFEECDVDSSDDAFVLKSNNPHFAVTNVVVRNSIARSHCYALKLGTASHGVMADIRFENIQTLPPKRDEFINIRMDPETRGKPYWSSRSGYYDFPAGCGGGAIAVECVDGGIVERVTFDNVEVYGYRVPIFVRGGTRTGRACGVPPSRDYILRNIVIRNIRGVSVSEIASSISGVDGCRASNVTLENVNIICRGAGERKSREALEKPVPNVAGEYPSVSMFRHILPAYGLWVDRADNVTLRNVKFSLRPGDVDLRPAISGPTTCP